MRTDHNSAQLDLFEGLGKNSQVRMCSRADQVQVVPIDFEGNSGRYDHFRYLS
jgi:acetoacetate decarboxylase